MTIPDWVTYPDDDWVAITPAEAGLDVVKFDRFLASLDVKGAAFGGEDHTGNKWGTVLTRGGYLLHTWGDRHYKFQTASLGKAFTRALVGFAVEEGRLDPDEPIHKTWTGEGQLSHPHKVLNQGFHRRLTWNHILGPKDDNKHYGGFAIERGSEYQKGRAAFSAEEADEKVPQWAKWTGDSFYDLYSHIEPGTAGHYSSAGTWRLSQALTYLWGRDLKQLLDEKLFSRIGIKADGWDWHTGRSVRENKYLYPDIPDSYTYLDPPFEINGLPVRSGPGWVVMSASDIARFGHLVATRGLWKGEQLLDPEWLRGHGGGNGCGVSGESRYYTAMGMVTTQGFDHSHSTSKMSLLPDDFFVGPVTLSRT